MWARSARVRERERRRTCTGMPRMSLLQPFAGSQMDSPSEPTLEGLWKSGPDGNLSPLSQVRVWALGEAMLEVGQGATPPHPRGTKRRERREKREACESSADRLVGAATSRHSCNGGRTGSHMHPLRM